MKCEAAFVAEVAEEMAAHRDRIPLPVDIMALLGLGPSTWWDDVVEKIQRGILYMIPTGWFDHLRATILSGLDRCVFRPGGVEVDRVTMAMAVALDRQVVEMGGGILSEFRSQGLSEFARAIERMLQTQGEVDLMRVAVGLERYRLRTGGYPVDLAGLLPRELETLPVDLVTGEALQYRVKTDGTPMIWAAGFNKVDDGGVPARRPEKLDWVWQYTGTPGQTESQWGRGIKP